VHTSKEKTLAPARSTGAIAPYPTAFAAAEIESDNLILRDAEEKPVRSKAQAAGLAEFGQPVWREDADEASVQGIIFSNGRHGAGRAEWILAGNYNIAVGRDSKIERAELRIRHQPGRLDRPVGSERDDGVVTLAIRADAGGQERSSTGGDFAPWRN
jgi:hypothetical protein